MKNDPSAVVGAATELVETIERALKAKEYDQAIPLLLAAARLAPKDADIANNLGLAFFLTRRTPDAVAWLRRAIELRPGAGMTHYNLGLALQRAGDGEGAMAAFRAAAALTPGHAATLACLADMLWERGKRREAAATYTKAADAAPGSTLGRLCRAKAFAAEDRRDEAARELRALIAADGSSSGAHLLLGHVLQESGRFDEAAASFERAIALSPAQATAHHDLVSSRRVTEAERPWLDRIEARLRAIDTDPTFSPVVAARQRMTLHFAAGKAMDDLGEFAGAMDHFDAANTVRGKLSKFDRAEVETRVDRLAALFTPELFAGRPGGEPATPTPVLILGMPRSGTTLLERVVTSHPAVRGHGELDFWHERGPAWIDAQPEARAAVGADIRRDYLALLARSAGGAPFATDKMPFNFLWAGLIHHLLPEARIVHVRRDPVDTCLSIYTTQFATVWAFASRLPDLAAYYRAYLRLVAHWSAVLPADRFLDVDYEAFVDDPEASARRLLAFAGLPWDPACLRPEENPDAVKTASKWQARQPIYRTSVQRWRRYEGRLGPLEELLALAPVRAGKKE